MSKKILVIDDDPDMVKIIKTNLEAEGFEVYITESGKEGLNIWRKVQPDLILLDVLMPEMDGLSFMKHAQVRSDLNKPVIIVLSAKEGVRDLFTMDGISGYISKPFEYEELLDVINQQLS